MNSIYASLTDEEAKIAGEEIAFDFMLKQDDETGRYITMNGTFTAIGIARRALRMIESAREAARQ